MRPWGLGARTAGTVAAAVAAAVALSAHLRGGLRRQLHLRHERIHLRPHPCRVASEGAQLQCGRLRHAAQFRAQRGGGGAEAAQLIGYIVHQSALAATRAADAHQSCEHLEPKRGRAAAVCSLIEGVAHFEHDTQRAVQADGGAHLAAHPTRTDTVTVCRLGSRPEREGQGRERTRVRGRAGGAGWGIGLGCRGLQRTWAQPVHTISVCRSSAPAAASVAAAVANALRRGTARGT